jgi:dienelactone hydrolase
VHRRDFLRLAAGAALAAAVPARARAAAPPCYPGGPFDPQAWLDERGQGLLKTRTRQSDKPLVPIKAQSLSEWKAERANYLAAWRELIGPWEAPPPLGAQVHSIEQLDAYTRIKVSYASLPSDAPTSRIPAWLLIPHGAAAPGPAIVCLHQTVPQGKDEPAGVNATLPWMAHADYYARCGYVTLAADAVGYGERTLGCGYASTSYELGDAWPILSTRPDMTLLGLMLFDVTRAVDYLQTRPEVDPRRIGVIGHSQGGFETNMVLGLEPRLRAGVASCGYGIFRHDPMLDRWASATSAYLPRMHLYQVNRIALPIDFLQVMALAAPTPHLVQTAMADTVWGIGGVAADPFVARELRRVHGFYGKPNGFVSVETDGDHGWYPVGQAAADDLFARVLAPPR